MLLAHDHARIPVLHSKGRPCDAVEHENSTLEGFTRCAALLSSITRPALNPFHGLGSPCEYATF